jgi:hypothetical protein
MNAIFARNFYQQKPLSFFSIEPQRLNALFKCQTARFLKRCCYMATGTQYTRFACHDIEFNSFRCIVALQKAIIRQNNMKTIEAGTFFGTHYLWLCGLNYGLIENYFATVLPTIVMQYICIICAQICIN